MTTKVNQKVELESRAKKAQLTNVIQQKNEVTVEGLMECLDITNTFAKELTSVFSVKVDEAVKKFTDDRKSSLMKEIDKRVAAIVVIADVNHDGKINFVGKPTWYKVEVVVVEEAEYHFSID